MNLKLLVALLALNISLTLKAQEYPFKVNVVGKGNPILLFPGFTCTGAVWNDVVQDLSKNYECHVFTFAGFGDVPAIETPWLAEIKNGVSEYIIANKLKKPTAIGHSLGGSLALWMATEKEQFSNIILIDALTSTGALMMPNFKSEFISYDNPYNAQLLKMNSQEFSAMALQMAQGMTVNADKIQQIVDWMLQADRNTYVNGYTDLLKLDLRDAVTTIKTPITILAATQPYGEETARKTYQEQYKNLEDYTLKFAGKSAHFIMFDQPKWLVREIRLAL
ncbi:alpha/beta hydrolase fold protein [Cellulophaga algicola DSM 14237]|uniref:Alpha/beta hydrolase fold protein n=1 Tax=Cellulophaga algicola (strain DSM 14237 / IC166 / ACAM 630) TaxID=688270 RepID=E6XAF0_CELAD|nr:alpha/beta hydrolase [Cellulophaga algicola]ADV48849.1 alpha/beta hydrolase fold protein [Cellulophaga algicola DSM 14237]